MRNDYGEKQKKNINMSIIKQKEELKKYMIFLDGNMAEKRFKLAFENFDGWAILDTTGEYSDDEDYIDWLSGQKAVDVLNELTEKNKELRLQLNLCSDQRNEFHRGLRENANRVGKLEKENEQLKKENKKLNCIMKQLEAKYEDKGFSLAYDMEECE